MRFTLAAATAAALLPTAAFAVDYMTADAAAKQIFPEADRIQLRDWQLDATQLQGIAAMGVRPRSTRWSLRLAYKGGEFLGVVVADEVLGKFELISYAVGVTADGRIKGLEILSYRESHGQEIRLPAWRKQFLGKTQAAPLKVGEDIGNISGATLSCSHVSEGVKRILAVVEQARRSGQLG